MQGRAIDVSSARRSGQFLARDAGKPDGGRVRSRLPSPTHAMLTALHIVLILLALWLISGTLLNFSKSPHWYVRGWDFPRVFTASLSAAVLLPLAIWFHQHWWNWAVIAGLAFVIVRQLWLIWPYTPLAKERVKWADRPAGDDSFTLVISNVLMENEQHDLWLRTIRAANPDVIVALEVNATWDRVIEADLAPDFRHRRRQPQENYYGMVIYSRLEFDGEPELKFLVQDDIPSIHATLILKDGQRVKLHALHPRPPEPLRDQDSAPRDAELVIVGKHIGKHEAHEPTVVCGDLNDVAWSYTTQLFLRLSKMLDPRMGRGQYASFSANSRIFRFPLDHVFHSNEFHLVDLKRLGNVGSDHFPMCITLACRPEQARAEQPQPSADAEDHEDAEEIVQEQATREDSRTPSS